MFHRRTLVSASRWLTCPDSSRGKGDYHRLGHGSDDHVRRPRQVQGLQGKKVIAIATGSLHCVCCTEDGRSDLFPSVRSSLQRVDILTSRGAAVVSGLRRSIHVGRQRRGPARGRHHQRHPEAAAGGGAAGEEDQPRGLRLRPHTRLVHQQAHQCWEAARAGAAFAQLLPGWLRKDLQQSTMKDWQQNYSFSKFSCRFQWSTTTCRRSPSWR